MSAGTDRVELSRVHFGAFENNAFERLFRPLISVVDLPTALKICYCKLMPFLMYACSAFRCASALYEEHKNALQLLSMAVAVHVTLLGHLSSGALSAFLHQKAPACRCCPRATAQLRRLRLDPDCSW